MLVVGDYDTDTTREQEQIKIQICRDKWKRTRERKVLNWYQFTTNSSSAYLIIYRRTVDNNVNARTEPLLRGIFLWLVPQNNQMLMVLECSIFNNSIQINNIEKGMVKFRRLSVH